MCACASLASALSLLALGCTKDEVKPDTTTRLGVLELPVSHRTKDAPPGAAARIEIVTGELLLDGESLLALDNGKIPAAERSGNELPKLKAKLAGKHTLALGVYAAVPYATLVRVLNTAVAAGAREVSFKVRKPSSSTETGWLTIAQSRFVESAEDDAFPAADLLPWDSFAKVWDDALTACQQSARADCGYKPELKAQGGKLDMMLRVRGSGLALRFRQAGAAPARVLDAGGPAVPGASVDAGKAASSARSERGHKRRGRHRRQKEELLDGIKAPPTTVAELPPEPATEHVFTLRSDQATVAESPISGIVQPLCGASACPIVLDAEGISMSGQVIALLGAAFPDGTPAPRIAWVLPSGSN